MQPSRDFEMQHQPQTALDADRDLLAKPPHLADRSAMVALSGGSAERSRNGDLHRARISLWPTTRARSAST